MPVHIEIPSFVAIICYSAPENFRTENIILNALAQFIEFFDAEIFLLMSISAIEFSPSFFGHL